MHECKTVTLRTRPLKKNMLSFYLDYYPGYRDKESMKVIRHESLGIYIYAEQRTNGNRTLMPSCRKKQKLSDADALNPS
jgi:hypothetical protein